MGFTKWVTLGSLMGLGSYLAYQYSLLPKVKVQTLRILSEKKLLEIFARIKVAYRDSFKKYQKIFRNGRRKLQRNSQEYANYVYDSYSNLQKVFDEAVDEVLTELHIPKEVYENSWRILKNDELIFEAAEEMKVISFTGHARPDLSIETIRDALEFCKEKIDSELGSMESLQLAISLLEDELKDTYGFEIEDFEKGYYAYMDNLNDYDSVFLAIKDSKSVIVI
jgi:hypothetical protein